MHYLLITIAILLIVSGLIGTVLPVLPGIILIWLGMLVYGYATAFAAIDTAFLLLMLGLTGLSTLLDYFAGAYGAKKYGASRGGTIGAVVGGFAGLFVAPPIGIILGPLVGAFAGEILAGRRPEEAKQASVGTFLGILFGTLLKLAIGISMVGMFIARLR